MSKYPILNNQLITAKGKRYKCDLWQGENPHYIFNSIEEEYVEPIEKSLIEVQQLLEKGIIRIGI